MEDTCSIFDITQGSGLNPEANEYRPNKQYIQNTDCIFDQVPELDPNASVFTPISIEAPLIAIPLSYLPPQTSLPEPSFKDIPMTKEIFQTLPSLTLPKNGESLKDHLCKSIKEEYKYKPMPQVLYDYMIQTGMI
jgi:hypothetical protein